MLHLDKVVISCCILCGLLAVYYTSLYVILPVLVVVVLIYAYYESKVNGERIHVRGLRRPNPLRKLLINLRLQADLILHSVMKNYWEPKPESNRTNTNGVNGIYVRKERNKNNSIDISQRGYANTSNNFTSLGRYSNESNERRLTLSPYSSDSLLSGKRSLNRNNPSPRRHSRDMSFSPKGSPWGTSVSPKLRSHGAGVKTVQTVAGPLLASTRYNININSGLYGDVNSPGFSSRVARYATDNSTSLTHQKQYSGPGQFPLVQLNRSASKLPVVSPRRSPGIIHSTVMVRVAPPESRLLDKSKTLSSVQEQDSTKSVLEVLKEISRKRIHSQLDDDIEDDSVKRQKKGEGHNSMEHRTEEKLETDSLNIGKRGREESPNYDDSSPRLHQQVSKRTRNNEIHSSLSSSRNLLKHMKRKSSAADWSRSSTPVIGKQLKHSREATSLLIKTSATTPVTTTTTTTAVTTTTTISTSINKIAPAEVAKPSEFLPKFAAVLDKNSTPVLNSVAALEAKRAYDTRTRLRSMLAVIAGSDDFMKTSEKSPATTTTSDSVLPTSISVPTIPTTLSLATFGQIKSSDSETQSISASLSSSSGGFSSSDTNTVVHVPKPSTSESTKSLFSFGTTSPSAPVVSSASGLINANSSVTTTSQFTFGGSAGTPTTASGTAVASTSSFAPATTSSGMMQQGSSSKPATSSSGFALEGSLSTPPRAVSVFTPGVSSIMPSTAVSGYTPGVSSSMPTTAVSGFTPGGSSSMPSTAVSGFTPGGSSSMPSTAVSGFTPGGNLSTLATTSSGFMSDGNFSSPSTLSSAVSISSATPFGLFTTAKFGNEKDTTNTSTGMFSSTKQVPAPFAASNNPARTLVTVFGTSNNKETNVGSPAPASLFGAPKSNEKAGNSASTSGIFGATSNVTTTSVGLFGAPRTSEKEVTSTSVGKVSSSTVPSGLFGTQKSNASVFSTSGVFGMSKTNDKEAVSSSSNIFSKAMNNEKGTTNITPVGIFGTNKSIKETTLANSPSVSNKPDSTSGKESALVPATFSFGAKTLPGAATPFQLAAPVGQSGGFKFELGSSKNGEENTVQQPVSTPATTQQAAAPFQFSFGSTATSNGPTQNAGGFAFGGVQKQEQGLFSFGSNAVTTAQNSTAGTYNFSASKPGGFAFGTSTTTTQPLFGAGETSQGEGQTSGAGGGGLFASTTTTTSSSGLFGSGGTAPAQASSTFGSGLFSTPSTQASSAFGKAPTPVFGSSATPSSQNSGPVFGAPSQPFGSAPQPNNTFGSAQQSTSLFGNTNAAPSTFSFGTSASVPAPAASTGTSLFGSGATPFQFGSAATPASGGFNFGTSGVNTSTPAINFGAGSSPNPAFQFGAGGSSTPAYGGQTTGPNMFSIGSGSTAPRMRTSRMRRQR